MNDGFVTLTLLSGRSLLEAVCRRLAVGCCCRAAVIIPTLHCSPFVHPSTIHHPPPLGCIQAPRHLSRYLVREQHNTNTQPRNPTRSSNNPRTRTFFPRAEGLFHQLHQHKTHVFTDYHMTKFIVGVCALTNDRVMPRRNGNDDAATAGGGGGGGGGKKSPHELSCKEILQRADVLMHGPAQVLAVSTHRGSKKSLGWRHAKESYCVLSGSTLFAFASALDTTPAWRVYNCVKKSVRNMKGSKSHRFGILLQPLHATGGSDDSSE